MIKQFTASPAMQHTEDSKRIALWAEWMASKQTIYEFVGTQPYKPAIPACL